MSAVLFDVCVNRRYALAAFRAVCDVRHTVDLLPPTAADADIMSAARETGAILVTEDVGFGALIFRDRLPPPPGVILISVWSLPHDERASRVAAAAQVALQKADGAFVALGPRRVRARIFPH